MRTLTAKQEAFAQAVASGATYSDAYRQCYNTTKASPTSLWDMAWKVGSNTLVAQRVQDLQTQVADAFVARKVWDLDRLVDETEQNLEGSRKSKQWGSANGAVEIIGRATGILSDKASQGPAVHITRVTVVLSDDSPEQARPLPPSRPAAAMLDGMVVDEAGESTDQVDIDVEDR